MKLLNLEFTRIAHDTFRIAGSKVIYTDPFKVSKEDKADIILLSHEHFDHLSVEDLNRVCTPETTIVASSSCKAGLQKVKVKEKHFIEPGMKLNVNHIAIEAVPAYNVNKFREPGKLFHPKDLKGVGFVFKMDETRVYHAGDTDFIPEMKSIQCDIALLPVSGTYVMTVEEAAKAAQTINPRIAVPMHYAAIVGSDDDAKKFKQIVTNCEVQII
ncbi:MAG: MBL fold metallo-hydrolase [Acidobacteria bacterium]|nr:MAG: MBL fold metallo-hydrolase [Acidobacteriota bacterium]